MTEKNLVREEGLLGQGVLLCGSCISKVLYIKVGVKMTGGLPVKLDLCVEQMSQEPPLSSRLQPHVSAQEILGRFGDLAPLQRTSSAKRRNRRHHRQRPSLVLSLGLVQDMIGFWETHLQESVPRPCGCGRENCPVSTDAYRAQHRWQCAIERIQDQLQERKVKDLARLFEQEDTLSYASGCEDEDAGSTDSGSESGESQSSNEIFKTMEAFQ